MRLPVLRRPPGSRALGEEALRARAARLLVRSGVLVLEAPLSVGPAPSPVPAAPFQHTAAGPASWEDPTAAPMADRLEAPHQPVKDRLSARIRTLLPWVVLVLGAMALAPWVIWAPLVGGLCLGALVLQSTLVARWLQGRDAAATDPSAGTFEGRPPDAKRAPAAPSGWFIVGILVLLVVQAAMLITTVDLKNKEPSAVAAAMRELRVTATERKARTGAGKAQAAPEDVSVPAKDRP